MIDHVKFFRDASPYVNVHRGKTFVVMLDSEGITHENFKSVLGDLALMNSLGIRVVLVHGAKTQIDQQLLARNIAPCFQDSLRITDDEAMACVLNAVGSTRIDIESALSMNPAHALGKDIRNQVTSGNFITAKPAGIRNGTDFHHTGEVRKVHRKGIQRLLDDGDIVLVSPLGYSPTGEVFNLSCEDVATQIAVTLKAEKLIILGAEAGVSNGEGKLQKAISLPDIKHWQTQLEKHSSLANAVQSAYLACMNGVERCHLISFTEDGSLLTELFTRDGCGTLIVQDSSEIIRQASIDDVGGILDLIQPLEEQGVLVKRSRELLETEISRFYVTVHPEGMIIGCAALYPISGASNPGASNPGATNTEANLKKGRQESAGELACVATHLDFCNQGLGGRLLAYLENKAKHELGINQLFVLTTQAAHWFQENGFTPSSLEHLPAEKAELYNFQRNSKIFSKIL